MEKFLNVKDDYVLKYAYYREPIAGSKYLDLNFDNLKVNEEVSFEIDSSNKYDDKAVKLYQNDFHLGYVHKNYIQEMIQVYSKRKDYKIEIMLNKVDIEKLELGFQIAFYQKYNNRTINILNRFMINAESIENKYYNLRKNKTTNQYYLLENNYVLTNSEVKKIKPYFDNHAFILFKGKKDNQIEVLIVI